MLRSMWDLPGPELEPVSPALAGGFLTTAPPCKPALVVLITIARYTSAKTKRTLRNKIYYSQVTPKEGPHSKVMGREGGPESAFIRVRGQGV